MRKKWSKSWIASKQPRKQRKYVYNAPLHILRKLMSVRFSKDLKQKYNKRNFPVRKGDTVKVMVGRGKGKIGKVETVDLKNRGVYIENVSRLKRDGTKLPLSIEPSNLMIIELTLDDKLRRKALEKK